MSVPTLFMTQAVSRSIRAHGNEAWPDECCGVLLGRLTPEGWRVVAAARAANGATGSAHNRYSLDLLEVARIERRAREQECEIAGFYHSHPNHPADWSRTDFEDAHWLDCCYVITSVVDGRAAGMKAFLLTGDNEDVKRFVELTITIEEGLA